MATQGFRLQCVSVCIVLQSRIFQTPICTVSYTHRGPFEYGSFWISLILSVRTRTLMTMNNRLVNRWAILAMVCVAVGLVVCGLAGSLLGSLVWLLVAVPAGGFLSFLGYLKFAGVSKTSEHLWWLHQTGRLHHFDTFGRDAPAPCPMTPGVAVIGPRHRPHWGPS